MLLLTASALAGSTLGWPCSRMNWAWRTVWNTCSINGFIPSGTLTDSPANFFRVAANHASAPWQAPLTILTATGNIAVGGTGAVPDAYCQLARNTQGNTATAFTNLRNRCRRAVDAYGVLVRSCTLAPNVAGNRGPIANAAGTFLPDWQPQAQHIPHVTNVQALTQLYNMCFMGTPANALFRSPITTCPGLLGWFSVVFTVCGFSTYGPVYVPNHSGLVGGDALTPLGAQGIHPAVWSSTGTNLVLCSNTAQTPAAWNPRGPMFRTSRCRKAVDQFVRTAQRCAPLNQLTTPLNLVGNGDWLKLMAGYSVRSHPVSGGSVNAVDTTPNNFNTLAPLCN